MKLLVDTHCWLWAFGQTARLNDEARLLLSSGEHSLYFSAASSWEIALKVAVGRLQLGEDPGVYVPTRLADHGYIALAIEHTHALHTATIPLHHGDPFDRLLVAQAQVENLTLLTADAALFAYDVELIWAGREAPPRQRKS